MNIMMQRKNFSVNLSLPQAHLPGLSFGLIGADDSGTFFFGIFGFGTVTLVGFSIGRRVEKLFMRFK